jgi:hypothetical protein
MKIESINSKTNNETIRKEKKVCTTMQRNHQFFYKIETKPKKL